MILQNPAVVSGPVWPIGTAFGVLALGALSAELSLRPTAHARKSVDHRARKWIVEHASATVDLRCRWPVSSEAGLDYAAGK